MKWTDGQLLGFALNNGAREVHRSWRDNMLHQGRAVSEERMNWETLSEYDKILDRQIAFDVIRDFVVWAEAHGSLS